MRKKIFKACLVHPHDMKYHREREMLNKISGVEGYENFPNLALLSIAPYFDRNWHLDFIDEDYLARKNLPRTYLQNDYSLVFITAMNHQAYQAYRIAEHFRKRGIHTVIGGMHPSALPEEALQHADTVVAGEGEPVMPTLLNDFLSGNMKKIYKSQTPADLTQVAPPLFSIVPCLEWYNKIPLFATRGCPRNCEFCCLGQVYGRSFRKKTPAQVAGEINMIKNIYKNPFISFADENMFADRQWAKELCRELIPLGVRWEAYCDISAGEDEELLDLLYEAGCVELLIGFETIDVKNLEITDKWKASQVKNYGEYIRRIQSRNIGVLACFVMGFDHDDQSTFPRLLDFLKENPVFELDIAALTPMPGTPLHDRLVREGRLISRKWDDYTWYHVNFQPMKLTPGEITRGIEWVFKEYSKPEMMRKRMDMFRHIENRLSDLEGRNAPREQRAL